MKTFLPISWAIFLLGIVFKFLHLEGASITTIIGCLLLLVHSFMFLVQNAKTKTIVSLTYLALSLTTTYFVFRIQFWNFSIPVFILAASAFISCIIVLLVKKESFKFLQIALVLYFGGATAFYFIHSYKVYYVIYLNPVLNSGRLNYDYKSWDKYSWFLYIAGKQDEAIAANDSAQKAVATSLKMNRDPVSCTDSVRIQQNKTNIENHSWTSFR